ncbi:MAG: carboxypeptidase-like regulatory domain-containing protein [Candidatus Cybelea sp.]
MNRALTGLWMLILAAFAASPAGAQTPLVVGSVRDQHGAAVAGAGVTGLTAEGPGPASTTDAAGTFALHGSGIVSVRITCRYCLPALVAVKPGEPIVAIVRRYDALASDSPSAADLTNLSYAHVESSVALHPFSLLAQSTTPYPGSTLSDRGLASNGSLLVDNGAPNYDIVDGESPYSFIPAFYEQGAVLRDATNAFAYGDQAGGGVVQLDPFVAGSSAEVATLGSDAIARGEIGTDSSSVAFGSFSNNEESRQRGDLFATVPLGAEQSFSVAGGSEQGRDYGSRASDFAGSFSFADAGFSDPRALNLSLSAVMDRGNYVASAYQWPTSTGWSDTGFDAGIHTSGPVVVFADAAVRSSTGFYNAQSLGLPRVGASLDQMRFDAGLTATGTDYALTAGIGAFWFDYGGGTYGVSQPARTALAVPSLEARLFPNGKWSLDLQGSGSFTLPTFVEQYLYAEAMPAPVQLSRNSLQAAILRYTDGARVRLEIEGASENVSGASSGKISSVGFSAVWQVAPAISLRTWTMHVNDSAPNYGTVLPYGAAPTVNAVWLTYDTGAAIRADAIYRRDLLNGLPFYHFDGAISGPIGSRLRWYAGAEDRMRRTFVDAGLRFSAR